MEKIQNISDTCDPLCEYCIKYKDKYTSIKENRPYWLTFSPPIPKFDIEPIDYFKYNMECFLQDLLYSSDNFICITEFKEERMHFHIFLSRRDATKYWVLVNKLKTNGIARSLKGEPLHGMHYLFKDIEDAIGILDDIKYIIVTEEAIKKYIYEIKRIEKAERQARSIKRKQEELKAVYAKLEVATPKWMLASAESEEEEE